MIVGHFLTAVAVSDAVPFRVWNLLDSFHWIDGDQSLPFGGRKHPIPGCTLTIVTLAPTDEGAFKLNRYPATEDALGLFRRSAGEREIEEYLNAAALPLTQQLHLPLTQESSVFLRSF
jgi:hypothetical protein